MLNETIYNQIYKVLALIFMYIFWGSIWFVGYCNAQMSNFNNDQFDPNQFQNRLQQSSSELSEIKQNMQSNWFSNKDNYEQNVMKPVMTGTPLYTLDRSKSGDAQIMCPGSQSFLEILIQPGSTGDLNFINIVYDSDLDGTNDKSYYVPGPVSGICANGIIKCVPGTWNNCEYYRWVFSGDNQLALEETQPGLLGGCYCINRSCNTTPSFLFKDYLLQNIGGGITGAMAQTNPRLAVANGVIEGYYIRYFAQNVGECHLENTGELANLGIEDPENTFTAAVQLDTLAEQELIQQSNDPNSPYYLLMNSSIGTSVSTAQCEKIRSVYFNDGNCSVGQSIVNGCAELERDPTCTLKEETVYDVYGNPIVTFHNFQPTGLTPLETCKEVVNHNKIVQCVLNCRGPFGRTDGGCPVGGGSNRICYAGRTSTWRQISEDTIELTLTKQSVNRCFEKATHPVCGTAKLTLYAGDDFYGVISIGGTTVYSRNDGTTGSDNSAVTVVKTVSTSGKQEVYAEVRDYGKCKTSASLTFKVYLKLDLSSSTYCYNWWKIKRIYHCESSEQQPDMTRVKKIDSTFSPTGDFDATYTDIVKQENGSWMELANQGVRAPFVDGGECFNACKVRYYVDPAQAAAGEYTEADYRQGGHWKTAYRLCTDGVCPVNDGEFLLADCSCLNEFNESISVLQAARLAAIDMICSGGQKANP